MDQVLVCRTSWMETYATAAEPAQSHHGWVKSGNVPGEALNFLLRKDGTYRGYVQVKGDSEGSSGRIALERLGGNSNDNDLENRTVVWAATHPKGGIRVVGGYFNATIFREARREKLPISTFPVDNGSRIYRIQAKSAVLLEESDRKIPLPRGKGGIGMSDLWYGLNEPEHDTLRAYILTFLDSRWREICNDAEAISSPSYESSSETVKEGYYLSKHRRLERRTQVRRFIYEKGCRCEACGIELGLREPSVWRSSFEIHHLQPYKSLAKDAERTITSQDVAVLCANCHRAIHRLPENTSVAQFRTSQGF